MFNNQAKWELEQHYRDPDRKKGYSSAETGHTCSVSAYHLLGPFCTSEYSSQGSDIITQNLERYIKSAKACNAVTEWFLKEIRYKIFCLHEYNLKVAEADYQKKYPLTPYLRNLLIQYVILECRYFQKSSRFPIPSSEVQIRKRILRLLFIVFGDYFRGLQVEPLKLSTECTKEVIRLFVELKSQYDIQSTLLDKTTEKLLQRIGTLKNLRRLQGKSLPCPIDPLLADPDYLNIRSDLIKELWADRLDLQQHVEAEDNDDEEEEIVKHSSLVPTIQLEDDNSHRIFWDAEADTHVRWWKSQNFTSTNGMSFIETIPLESSDEESTSGHSHCDIVNTIDVNISNKDLISSHQASPYVVAFNVKDGDKGVILSNKKKTSSQFVAGDAKERKTTVFSKKPFLGNSRTLGEHSVPSTKEGSQETDEDLKPQSTKSRLIQKTNKLHYTINISNEIFGFDKFLTSRDSEYSYRKSTKDYKETPILHSKHQNTLRRKGAAARQKRDGLQSVTFFDNLITKLNKPHIKLKRAKLKGCNFRELECFGGKLEVQTKISTEVIKNKSRKPTGSSKTVFIEISSDEDDVASTNKTHVKLEKSRGSGEAPKAEKVALKRVPENKNVAKPKVIEEGLQAANSRFSSDNCVVIEANKSITTPCDKSIVDVSENRTNVAEIVNLPKGNIETSKNQISDKDAENLQNKSHVISEVTLTDNKELPETLKLAEKVQNITIQGPNDKESIEPNLSTENITTDVDLRSELQNVEEAQDSGNVNEELDVINKDEVNKAIIEEFASNKNKTVDKLEVHGEGEAENSVTKQHTLDEQLENTIETSSTCTRDEAHLDSASTKSSEPSSRNDTKKIEKSKNQTESTPTQSMLGVSTYIEINKSEEFFKEKEVNNEISNTTNTESSLSTGDGRLEKSDEVHEEENGAANKQPIESKDVQINEIEKTLGISGEDEKKGTAEELITSNEPKRLEGNELAAEDLQISETVQGKSHEDVRSLENQEHGTKSTETDIGEEGDSTVKPEHTKGPPIELNLSTENVAADEEIAELAENSNKERNISNQISDDEGAVECVAEHVKENPEFTLTAEQSKDTGSTIVRDSVTDNVEITDLDNTNIHTLNRDEIHSENDKHKKLESKTKARNNIPTKKVISKSRNKKLRSRKKYIIQKPTNLVPEDEKEGDFKISKSSCADSHATTPENLLEKCSNFTESSYENITDHGEHSSNTDTAVKDKESDKDVTEESANTVEEICGEIDVPGGRAMNAVESDNNKQLQEVPGEEDGDAVKTNEEFLVENDRDIEVAKVADGLEDCVEPVNDATSAVKETDIETLEQHEEDSIAENIVLHPEIYPCETVIHQTLPCSETQHLIKSPIEDHDSADQSIVEDTNVSVLQPDEISAISDELVMTENEILPVDHGKTSPVQEIIMNDFVASYETVNTESHSDVPENLVPEVQTNFDSKELKADDTLGSTEKLDNATYLELPSNLQDSITVKDVNLPDKTEVVHDELDHVNLDDNIPVASEVEIEYSEAYEGVPAINTEDCSIPNSLFEAPKMTYENSNSCKSLNVPLKPRGRKQRAPRGRRASICNRMTSIANGLCNDITIEHIKTSVEPTVVPSLTTDKVPRGNSLLYLATVALDQSHCGIMVPEEDPKVSKHERNQSPFDIMLSKGKPKVSKHERKPRQKRKYNEEGVKRLTRSSSRKSSLSSDVDVKPHDFLYGATTLPKSVNVFNQYVAEPVAVSERSDESNDRLLIDDDGVLMEKEQNVSVSAPISTFNDDQMEDSLQFEFEGKSIDNHQGRTALDYNFKPFRTKAEKKAYSTNSLYVSLEKLHTKEIFENIKHFRSKSLDIDMLRPTHSKKEMSKLALPLAIESLDVEPLEMIEPPKISAKGVLSTPKNSVKKSPARRKSKPRDTLDKTSATPKKLLTSRKLKFANEVSTNEMVTGDEIEFNQEVEINTELPGTLSRNKKVKAKLPAKGKRSKVIEDTSFEKQQASTEIIPNKEVPQISLKNKKGKAKLPAKDKRIKKISESVGNFALTSLNSENQLHDTETVSNKELLDISTKKDEKKLPVKVTKKKSVSNSSENLSINNELNSRKQLDIKEVTPNKELLQRSQENKKGKAKLPSKGKKLKLVSVSNENLPLTDRLDFEKQLNFTEMTPNKEQSPTSLKDKLGKSKSPVGRRNRTMSFCGENVPLTNELNFEKQLTGTEMTSCKKSLPISTDTKKDQAKPRAKGARRKSVSRSSENVPLPDELFSEKQLDSAEVVQNDKSLQSSLKNKANREKLPTKVRRNKSASDFGVNLPVNREINSGKQLDRKEMTQTKELPQASPKNKAEKAKLPVKIKRSKSVSNSGENRTLGNELSCKKQLDSKEMTLSKEQPQASLKNKTDQAKLPTKGTKNKSITDFNKTLLVTNEINSEIQLNSTEMSQNIQLIKSPPKNKTNKSKLVKRNKSIPDSGKNLLSNEINSVNQLKSIEKIKSEEPSQALMKNKTDKAKLPAKVKRSISFFSDEVLADNELDLGKRVDGTEMNSQVKTNKAKLPVKVKQSKLVPDSDQNLPVPTELNLRDTTKPTSNKELLQAPLENKKGKAKLPVKNIKNRDISDSTFDLNFEKALINADSPPNKQPLQDPLKSKKEKPKSSPKSKEEETEDCLEDLPLAILKKLAKDEQGDYDELPLIVRMNLKPNQPEKKPKEKSSPNIIKKTPKLQENKNDVKAVNKDSSKIKSPNKKTRKRDHIVDVKEENTLQPVVKQKIEDTAPNTDCKRIKLNNVEADKVQESVTEKVFTLPLKLRRKSSCKDTLSKFSGLSSPTEIIARNVEDVKPATGLDKKYMSPPKLRVKNLTDDERESLEQNETSPEPVTTPTSLDNLFKCKNTIMSTTEKLKKKLKSDLIVQDPLIDPVHVLQYAEVKDVSNKSLSPVLAKTSIEEKEDPLQTCDNMKIPSVTVEEETLFQTSDEIEIPSVTVEKSIEVQETPLQSFDEIEVSSVTVEKSIEKEKTPLPMSDEMEVSSITIQKSTEKKESPLQTSNEVEVSPVTDEKSTEKEDTPLQTCDEIEVSSVTAKKSTEKEETPLHTSDETEVSSITVQKSTEKEEIPLQTSDETEVSSITVQKSTEKEETPLHTSDETKVSSITVQKSTEKEEIPLQTYDEIEVPSVAVEKSIVEEKPLQTSDEVELSSITAEKSIVEDEAPLQTSDEVEVSSVTAEKPDEKEETSLQISDEVEVPSVTAEKSSEKEETPLQTSDEVEISSLTAETSIVEEETLLQTTNQMELCEEAVKDVKISSEDVTETKETRDVPLIHNVIEEQSSNQPENMGLVSVHTEIKEDDSEGVCITSQEIEVVIEPIDYSLNTSNNTTLQKYEDIAAETSETLISKEQIKHSTKSTSSVNEESHGLSDYPIFETSAPIEPEKQAQNETNSLIMENQEEMSSKDCREEKRQISEVITSETQKVEVSTNSVSITEKLERGIAAQLTNPAPSTPILIENEVLHEKLEQITCEKEEIPEVSSSQQQIEDTLLTDSVSSVEKSQTNIDMDSSLSTPPTSKTHIRRSKEDKQRERKQIVQNLKTQNKSPTNTHQIKRSTFVRSSNKISSKEMLNKVTPKTILHKFKGIKGRSIQNKKSKVSRNEQEGKSQIIDVKETPDTTKDLNESTSDSLIQTIDAAIDEINLNSSKQESVDTIHTSDKVEITLTPSVTCSSTQISSLKKEKKSIESIISQLKENNVSVKPTVVVENLKKKLQEKIQYTTKDAPLILLKKGNEKFSPMNYRNKKIKRSETEITTASIIPKSKQEMEIINDNLSKEVSSQEPNKSVVDEPTSKLKTTQPLETTQLDTIESIEQSLANKDKITDDLNPSKSILDIQTKSDSDNSFLSIDSSHLEQDSSLEVEKTTGDPPLPEVPAEKVLTRDQSERTPQDALVTHDASIPVSEPKINSNEVQSVSDVPSSFEISELVTDPISTSQHSSMELDTSSSSNKESTCEEESAASIEPENSSKYLGLKIVESTTETISTVHEESMSIQSSLPIFEETIPLNDSVDHIASSSQVQSTDYLMSLVQDVTTVAVASTTYQEPTPTDEFASCLDQKELTLIGNSLPHCQESTVNQGEPTDYLMSTAQDPNYLIPTNQHTSVGIESLLCDRQELPNINESANCSLPTNQDESMLIDDSFNCHITNSESDIILNQSESISSSNLPPQHESALELVSKTADSIGHIFTVDSIVNNAPIPDVSLEDFVASTQHKEPENQLATDEFSIKEEPLSDLLLTYEESISDVKSDLLSLVSGSSVRDINECAASDLSVELASSPPNLHVEPTTDFREITQLSTLVESESTSVAFMKAKNLNLPVIELSDISPTVTTKSNEISFVNPPLQSNFTKVKTEPNFSQQVHKTIPSSFSKSPKKGLSLPLLEPTIAVTSKSRDLKRKSSIKASETVRLSNDLSNSKLIKSSSPMQNLEPPVESLGSSIETFDSENYEENTSCVKGLNCHNVIKEIQRGQSKSMPTLEMHDAVTSKTHLQIKSENKELETCSMTSKVFPRKRVVRFDLPETSPINLPSERLKRKNPFKSVRTLDTFEGRPVPDLIKTTSIKVKNETEVTNLDKSRISTSTTVSPKKGLDLPKLETSDFTENIYNKSPKKAGRNLDMPILETSPSLPVVSKKFRRSSTDERIVQDSTGPRGNTTKTRKKSLDLPIVQPSDVLPENKIPDKSSSRKSAAPVRDLLSRALVGVSLSADRMSSAASTSKCAEVTSPSDFLHSLPPKYSIALTSSDSFQQARSVEQRNIDKIDAPVSMEDGLVSKPMEYEEFKKWITGVVPEPLIKLQEENFENCLVSDMSTEAKCIPEVHSEVEVYCEKPDQEGKSPYFSAMGEVSTEFLNSASQQDSMRRGDEDQIPFTLPDDDIDAPEYTGEVVIEHDMRDELIGEIIQSPSFINDSEESSRGTEAPMMPQVLSCLDSDASKPGPSGCQAVGKRRRASSSDMLNFQDISPNKFSQTLELMSPKISYSNPNFGGEANNVMLSSKMIDDTQTFSGCTPRTEIRCCLDDTTDHTYHHLGGPLLSMFSHNFNNDPLEQSSDNFNSHLPDLSKASSGEIGESHNTSEPYLVNFSLSDFENINLIDLSTSENKSDRKKIDITNVPLMEEMELPDKTWQQFNAHNPKVVVVMNERCSTPTYSMSEDIFGSESNSERSQSADSQSPIRMEEPKVEVKSAVKGKAILRAKDALKSDTKEVKDSSVNSKAVPSQPSCQIIKVKQNLFPENKSSSLIEKSGNLETKQNEPLSNPVTTTPDKPSPEASNTSNPLKAKKKLPLTESEVSAKRFRLAKKKADNPAMGSNIVDAVKLRQRKSTNRYTSEPSKKPFDKMGSFLDSPARISDTSKFLDEFNQKVSSEKETLKKNTTKSTPTRSASPQQEPQHKEPNLKGLTKRLSPIGGQQDSLTDNLLNYGLKMRFSFKGSQNVRVERVETSSQEGREAVEQSEPVESPRASCSTAKDKPEASKSSNSSTSHAEDFKVKDSDYFRRVKMADRETSVSPSLTDNLLNHNLLRRELSRPSYKSRPPEPPGHFVNYTSRPSTSGTSKSAYDSRSKEKYPPWYEAHYKPKYVPESDREAPDSNKPWNYNQDPNRRTYSKNMLANDFSYRDYNRPPPGDYNRPPPGDYNRPSPGDYSRPPPGDYNRPPPGDYNRPPPGDYSRPPPGDYNRPPPGDYNRPPPDPSKRSANGVNNHSIDHILNRDSTKHKQYKSEDGSKRSSSSSEEDRMRKMRKGESEFDSLYKTGNQNPNFKLKVTKANRLKLVKQRNRFYDETEYYKEHEFGRVSPRELRESSGSSHRSYPGGGFMDREKKFRGKADYSGSLHEMPRSMSSDRMRGNSSTSDFRDMRTCRESQESMDKKNERRYKDSSVMGEAPHGRSSLSPERSKGSSKDARDKSQDEKNKPGRQKEWFEIFNEKFKEYDYGSSSAPKFW